MNKHATRTHRSARLQPFSAAMALTAIAGAAPLSAQGPFELLPADTLAVAWVDAPSEFADDLSRTRLARVLRDPTLWRAAGVDEDWMAPMRAALEDAHIDADELLEQLAEYSGRVVIGAGIDIGAVRAAIAEGTTANSIDFAPWCALILGATDGIDLGEVALTLRDVGQATDPDRITEIDAAGHTIEVLQPGDVEITLPFLVDDHLMVLVGENVERTAQRLLSEPRGGFLERCTPPDESAAVWIDAAAVSQLAQSLLQAQDDTAATVADLLGIDALRAAWLALSTREDRVVLRTNLTLDHTDGLISALTDISKGPPSLLRAIPTERDYWSIGKYNLHALYDAAVATADALADVTGETAAELEDQFAAMFRVRLREDLLDHVGEELLSVGAGTNAGLDPDAADDGGEGTCWGLQLRDGRTFGEHLERALRSRGLHATRRKEVYRDEEVFDLSLFGAFRLFYCVTDDLLLLGFGEPGAGELRAILDAAKRQPSAGDSIAPPAHVAALLEQVTPGWQGITVTRLPPILEGTQSLLFDEAEGEEWGQVAAVVGSCLQRIAELTQQYGAHTMVGTTYADQRGVRSEVIW